MSTITALNVRLGMDASNFAQGADLARAEVNKVARVLRQSEPPAEKFKKDLDLLNRAFSESGKSSKEYANALEFLRKKHGQMEPSVKKASGSLGQLKDSMLSAVPGGGMLANALQGPAGAALALGAAAAVAWRNMMIAAQRIDETAKAAKSLGIAYGDLVAIQMLAGESAGIDPATVNRGIGQFTRKLAEARVNGGALAETMKAIGLDATELAGMDTAEAFRQVSDAIANIPDKAEQIRVTTMLLGEEGAKMVEVFRQGGGAIDAMNKEAERLGTILSDQSVKDVEAMNDAFGRVNMSIEGIWNQMLADLAPTLTEVAKLASDFFVMVRKASEASKMLSPALMVAAPVVQKMVDGFRAIIALANDIIAVFTSMKDVLSGGELNLEFAESGRLLDELEARSNGTASAMEESTAAAEALAIETQRAADAAAKIEETFQKQVDDLNIMNIELSGNADLAEEMRLEAQGYNDAQIEVLMTMRKQNEEIRQRAAAEREAAQEATKAAEAMEREREKQAERAKKDAQELEKAFEMEVSSALAAAKEFFAAERQKDQQMRDEIAKGPSSIEAGSSEAARFMADQVNAQIGASAIPERPSPGEKEIADKTQELLVAQREANTQQTEELETMKQLLVQFKENGFKRIR